MGSTQSSNNGRGSDSWCQTWSHFRLDRPGRGYCRVTFDDPPINTITATRVAELSELVGLIEQDQDLNVVVFTSANPDFYLAHYDVGHDPRRTAALPTEPTGMNAWLDLLVRLARAPVVSIASIRGRARGAGSEFVLACDLRFASRENTLLGQFEVATGLVLGGGPMARLSRLVGRGRALEILLVADDCDEPHAEQYGYINRAIPDAQLNDAVDGIATRLSRFDHEAIARTKSYVDRVTLPPDSELRRPCQISSSCSGAPCSRRITPGSRRWGSTSTATSSADSVNARSRRCLVRRLRAAPTPLRTWAGLWPALAGSGSLAWRTPCAGATRRFGD